MMDMPKGLEFWYEDGEETKIRDDAPEWAKKEFKEYQEQMDNTQKNDTMIYR